MPSTVHDEPRLAASLRLLSTANKVLAASFDVERNLELVAALVVPAFATGIAVELVTGPTDRRFIAVRGDVDEATAFALVSRGRNLGTLLIGQRADAPLDELAVDVFGDLAVRIAVAVDSAHTYEHEHRIADMLQRALLPEHLPALANIQFDAAYLPSSHEAAVGGDWYDACTLPDGRIAISIGDVAGHGLTAAIAMGEVRQAFRAAALKPKSASAVLERANAIINMRANPVMVTAIFGIIDPRTSTLTYATAGHPPPVIALADGSAQRLPGAGIPLGISDRIDAQDWTFTLPPGSRVAFYTDGLIEYSRDIAAGEARLLEALAAGATDRSAPPARALLSRILATAKPSDDIAVLIVSVDDARAGDFAFDFTALPQAVPLVRRALARYLSAATFASDDVHFRVTTAVGEALANAVEHAYREAPGIVRLRVSHTGAALVTTVEDDGSWKAPNVCEERGRGLPLMRALMSGVDIRTQPSNTTVELTLAL
jgi:anti-sigma regulatory factor (Ser/Thr protein kinase)